MKVSEGCVGFTVVQQGVNKSKLKKIQYHKNFLVDIFVLYIKVAFVYMHIWSFLMSLGSGHIVHSVIFLNSKLLSQAVCQQYKRQAVVAVP